MAVTTFAICRLAGAPSSVRTVAVTAAAQFHIEEMLNGQSSQFLSETLNRVDFDPTYSTDEESVLWIKNFEMPEHIQEAIDNPNEIPVYSKDENIRNVRALFHESNGVVFFQCWRNFDFLGRPRVWLLNTGGTFDLQEKIPLVLERRIDAVFSEGNLFFKSYANTATMLELLSYVTEATQGDIEAFTRIEWICGDATTLGGQLSPLHRRQIRLLVNSRALENQTLKSVRASAEEVEYDLPISDGKVQIPPGGRALSDLLHFFNDRIYRGILTGHALVATSARRRRQDS